MDFRRIRKLRVEAYASKIATSVVIKIYNFLIWSLLKLKKVKQIELKNFIDFKKIHLVLFSY